MKYTVVTGGTAPTYSVVRITGTTTASVTLREVEVKDSTLPALRPMHVSSTPYTQDLALAKRQQEDVILLTQALKRAKPCEGCLNFRRVVDIPDPNDWVDMGMFGAGPRERVRRMCAHPAYSQPVVDFSRGKLDFVPRFTCEESRGQDTVCGLEGRLWMPEKTVSESRMAAVRAFGRAVFSEDYFPAVMAAIIIFLIWLF